MKKKLITAVLLCFFTLTACPSNSESKSIRDSSGGSAAPSAAGMLNNYYKTSDGYEMDIITESEISAKNFEAGNTGNSVYTAIPERKIIKNASLGIESTDVTESYEKFLNYVKSVGGYEFSKEMSRNENYVSVSASIKVTPEILDDVLNYASDCGEVKYINTSGNDITSNYYDIQIRLENKKRNLQKYYEYIDKAENVEELVKLQNEIDRLTAEIESYEGQIKLWDSQVSESTINLSVYKKHDPEIIEKVDWGAMSVPSMGTRMLNGFKTVCNVIAGFIQWIVILVFSALPFIIICVAAVIIAIRIRKRRKTKTEDNDKNKS